MRAALAALLLLAGPVLADPLDRSLRPLPNPAYAAPVSGLASSLRPRPRPLALAPVPDQGLDLMGLRVAEPAPEPEPKPKKRRKDKETASKKGSVCGVAAIKGEKIAPIKAKVQGCGLKDGVRVTSVSGVRLSQPATIDCATAKALNTWVARVLQPAYGGGVVELKVAAHYVCRSRNNVKGAKISEHGRGKAIDIAGLVLESGRTVMVAGDFDRKMRRAYKGACGVFATTLGPGSDGYHEDHMHFDTGAHGGGAYCR